MDVENKLREIIKKRLEDLNAELKVAETTRLQRNIREMIQTNLDVLSQVDASERRTFS